jgi:hypothetical protein
MIPAYTRYAAPLTALTLMNDKELRRASDSLTAAMADGTCRNAVFPLIFFIREVSVVGRWVIGLSSDELVSSSPGLSPSHDETFW